MSSLINRNFLIRTVSGIALFVVVVGAILLSPYTMLALLAVICMGCMLELYKIARQTGADPLDTYTTLVGVLVVLATFFVKLNKVPQSAFYVLIPALFLLFIFELYRRKEQPFANIAWAVVGLLYVTVPMALLAYMPVQPAQWGYVVYRPMMVLSIFLIVWANDVGAYLFGVTLGRHPLFKRISPKKSWEGFVGGLLCAIGVGIGIASTLGASLWFWGGAATLIAVTGVWGDLVESMLKRSVGLKDSGTIIPGHGGFLDRFDALLLAIPFLFVYFIIFARYTN